MYRKVCVKVVHTRAVIVCKFSCLRGHVRVVDRLHWCTTKQIKRYHAPKKARKKKKEERCDHRANEEKVVVCFFTGFKRTHPARLGSRQGGSLKPSDF